MKEQDVLINALGLLVIRLAKVRELTIELADLDSIARNELIEVAIHERTVRVRLQPRVVAPPSVGQVISITRGKP